MRRLTLLMLLSGALLSFNSAAQSAPRKVYYKAPPPAPVASSAIAFYAGVNMGYGWSRFSAPIAAQSVDTNGVLGGVQFGANYQIDKFVLGVEGDFDLSSMRGSQTSTLGGTAVTGGPRHLWFATFTGRAGYAFQRSLAYIKGGAAWTRYKWDFDAPVGSASSAQNRTGWTVGVGVEQAVTDLVSVKLEYDYLDFGTRTETLTTTGGIVAAPTDVKLSAHLVKLGVNYRFSGGH